jgi:hypothetical protein
LAWSRARRQSSTDRKALAGIAGTNIGHAFPLGWLGTLERLYADIDAQLTPEEKERG